MNEESQHGVEKWPGESEAIFQTDWWVGGWVAPTVVTLFTIFWLLGAYWLIGWRQSTWQHNIVPYVPAESIFTSDQPSGGTPPKQVELPQPSQGGTNAQP